MFIFVKNAIKFDRTHVMLNNFSHLAGGFGLALVLQDYFVGNSFLSVEFGWILLVFSAAIHIYSFTKQH